MAIIIHYDGNGRIDLAGLRRFTSQAKRQAKLKGDVGILITSSPKMKELNLWFRKQDKPTDVLSFPGEAHTFAGDIAISSEIAAASARRLGHSLQKELKILILHGLLHLAGYDHLVDDGEMAKVEDQIRSRFGLPRSLILRANVKTSRPSKRKKSGSGKKPVRIDKVPPAASGRGSRPAKRGRALPA